MSSFTVSRPQAIVVGGSLAGLMAAISLAQEEVGVTVLEKSGPNRESGGGLRVDGSSLFQSKTEKLLRELASGGKRDVQLWSAIESRLRNEVLKNPLIELHFEARVVSVGQDAEKAWVETEEGTRVEGDFVVGADGHRSLVRQAIAPDHPNAAYAGFLVWIASVEESALPASVRQTVGRPGVQMLDGGLDGFLFGSVLEPEDPNSPRRVGCAWYDNTQTDLLYELGCVKEGVVQHSLKGADIPEETLQKLQKLAKSKWPEPFATATVQALTERSITGIPIKEYVPEKLVTGRLLLTGDAAHVPAPITAGGFNQSLKDAVVLGECIQETSDVRSALRTYEKRLLKPVRRMVQSGQSFSRSFGQQ